MFLSVAEKEIIKQRAIKEDIPEEYITDVLNIVSEVINREARPIKTTFYEPITADDYD